MVINKLIINGNIAERYDYSAVFCGKDIARETYFYDLSPKDEKTVIRFFGKGNELKFTENGIYHSGNGGIFGPYMFDRNVPFADFIRTNILNRLIIYGAHYIQDRNYIAFSPATDGFNTFEELFANWHALYNWYFFVTSKFSMDMIEKQKWLLKHAGKFIKTNSLVGADEENAPLRLADSLVKTLPEEGLNLFVLRLTDRNGKRYKEELLKKIASSNTKDPKELSRMDIDLPGLPQATKDRIKLDTMYRLSENRTIVDTYKSILVEAYKYKSLPQAAQNYIQRFRDYMAKKSIPTALTSLIDEKLPVRVTVKENKDFVSEFKLTTTNITFINDSFGSEAANNEIKILLNLKHRAFLENNKSFESALINVGKKFDEIKDEDIKLKQMDIFSKILTYYDKYDACATSITKIAFGEERSIDSTKIISLANHMEAFDVIEEGLFKRFFIEPLLENRYLSNYGIKKTNLLIFGLEEITRQNKTVSEVIDELTSIIEEESAYRIMTNEIRNIGQGKTLSMIAPSDRARLKEKLSNRLKEHNIKRFSEELLDKVIQDYNVEILYFTETIPNMIMNDLWDQRMEFMQSSGLDVFRIEEIEKIYCARNHLKEDYISSICASKLVSSPGRR